MTEQETNLHAWAQARGFDIDRPMADWSPEDLASLARAIRDDINAPNDAGISEPGLSLVGVLWWARARQRRAVAEIQRLREANQLLERQLAESSRALDAARDLLAVMRGQGHAG